jgi:hypothetical protein
LTDVYVQYLYVGGNVTWRSGKTGTLLWDIIATLNTMVYKIVIGPQNYIYLLDKQCQEFC